MYFLPWYMLKLSVVATVRPGIFEKANRLSNEWFSSIRTKTYLMGDAGRTGAGVRLKESSLPESNKL